MTFYSILDFSTVWVRMGDFRIVIWDLKPQKVRTYEAWDNLSSQNGDGSNKKVP